VIQTLFVPSEKTSFHQWAEDKPSMTPPEIQALGISRQWSTTDWKAAGYAEGMDWLEAWGASLIAAMEALRALARSGMFLCPCIQ
jgi:hypothetical protein